MRIAIVVGEFPSISETFILSQITGLLDLGHDVDVFAAHTPLAAKVHPVVDEYRLRAATRYTTLRATHGRNALRALRWVITNPAAFRALRPPSSPGRRPVIIRRLGLAYVAGAFADRAPYDVIHCHFGGHGATIASLRDVGAVRGRLLITSFHGSDVNAYPRACRDNPYRDLFRLGDLFTATTDNLTQKLLSLGCPPERLVRHPVSVDVDRITCEQREDSSEGTVRITTVARLAPEKGIEYAIRAIVDLHRRRPDLRLAYQIAGGGALQSHLQSLIDQLEAREYIRLLGWLTDVEVRSLLSRTDVFVLASTRAENGAEEGAGVVLLEAQAAGVPVVATRVGGIPEMLRDGETGYLVNDRDISALTDRLESLIDDRDSWEEIGGRGRRFVETHFSTSSLNQRLVELYTTALGNTVNA